MDAKTTMIIVLSLVSIFFIVCGIFSVKTWRWVHVTFLFLVYPAAIVFLILAACVLRTHDDWRKEYNTLKAELDLASGEADLASIGRYRNELGELKEQEESVDTVIAELGRELLDRGRVWRNCVPNNVDGGTVTLDMSQWGDDRCVTVEGAADEPEIVEPIEPAPVEPAAVEPAEGEAPPEDGAPVQPAPAAGGRQNKQHGIETKLIVYAFFESRLDAFRDETHRSALFAGASSTMAGREQFCTLPTVFIGEFQVTGATETTITMSPILPLMPHQQQVMGGANSTWTIYEMMPLDSHIAFEPLDDDQRRKMMQVPTVDEYVRDGKAGDRQNDPEQRVWVKVKFKQDYDEIVVDAAGDPPMGPSTDFDSAGQAVPAWLRHGDEASGNVKFSIGDVGFFDQTTAKTLMDQGICDEVDRVYKRELRDYEYLYHELYRRKTVLRDESVVLLRDIAILSDGGDAANELAKKYEGYRNEEITNLKLDLAKFKYERSSIERYRGALAKQHADLRGELSRLYRTNAYLAAQLTQIQAKMTERINRRAAEAAKSAMVTP